MKDEKQPKAEMNSYEQRKEIYRRLIRSLRLIDDAFMNCVFDGNIEGTTLLLRIILGKSSLAVLEVNTQETLHNLQGRSRRLDILARDGEGSYYNIEVQRENAGAAFIRADEHSSLLMAKTHAPNCEPQDVPERWVIFITENDVIGLGLPLYPIERKLTVGDGRVIDDKEHMLYVNGAYKKKTTAIGRLMHDFFCEAELVKAPPFSSSAPSAFLPTCNSADAVTASDRTTGLARVPSFTMIGLAVQSTSAKTANAASVADAAARDD